MGERVVVTGLGVVSSLGINIEKVWSRIVQGQNNIKKVDMPFIKDMRSTLAACVEEGEYTTRISKVLAYAKVAVANALQDAGLNMEYVRQSGIAVASANGSIDMLEKYLMSEKKQEDCISQYAMSCLLNELINDFNLEGPSFAVSTACASGNIAIARACDMIRNSEVTAMIAGGTECISHTIMGGFNALRAVSAKTCRPFDQNRDGMIMGEGAAFLVLENLSTAMQRGAHIYCEIVGAGLSCDAFNMTNPNGIGLEMAMKNALREAGVTPQQIDYINAHGTATPANDAAEAQAIKKVMGNMNGGVAIGSTKSSHGHMLGAAGAMEAVVCALVIDRNTIPPTANTNSLEDEQLGVIVRECRTKQLNCVISNSQAFGGSNAVLVFRKADRNESL